MAEAAIAVDVFDAAFRYLPPRAERRNHYKDEPWFEWLAIEYHLSQSCALESHTICNPRGWGYRCPRMPLGYCECVCHG